MSEHISWATCPQCGRAAAVGWIGGSPVEFDCVAGCQLTVAQLHDLAADVAKNAARQKGRGVATALHRR